MNEIEIHQRESTEDTESFLQENIEKFEIGAVFLLKKMLTGERLTAKDVMQKYGIHDRRLRDLFISGKCQREWVLNDKGKRLYVEYFIPIPKPITKTELIEKTNSAINNLRVAEDNLVTVFELDENPPTFIQQQLFP